MFLVNPPSAEPVRSPLLGFGYLAAGLAARGHAVALVDASAVRGPTDPDEVARRARDFGAELVGLHVKTLHAQQAYAFAGALAARLPSLPLVAGGPHPTVAPLEPLARGFSFSLADEGDEALPELADALDGRRPLDEVRGLAYLDGAGAIRATPPRGFLLDLDALPSPLPSLALFDPAWYGAARPVPFGGVLSSRGCPAACTFCSNNVTGRRFRYRSAAVVADEVRALRDGWNAGAFVFFDDSFAVGRRRLEELSRALAAVGSVPWSCTAHPAHLDPEVLALMKAAGCGGIDIGMESGDPSRLVRIGKGVTVERVRDVLGWCRDAGLHVVVNLMFGWPEETAAELEATFRFMEDADSLGAMFNARGVLVPYPGTEIYDDHHRRYGFTEWWIREPPLDYKPFPSAWSEPEIRRAYADDAALDRNFFKHDKSVLQLIDHGLQMKAQLTFNRLFKRPSPSAGAVPAAGAR